MEIMQSVTAASIRTVSGKVVPATHACLMPLGADQQAIVDVAASVVDSVS